MGNEMAWAAGAGAVLGAGDYQNQAAGELQTGTMALMDPEQLKLLLNQLGNFNTNNVTQQFGFNTQQFQQGTMAPIMENLKSEMGQISNQYAGQGLGSERLKANQKASEAASAKVGQAFAQQSAAMEQAKMQAYNQQLATLLGARPVENYAVATEGAANGGNQFMDMFTQLLGGAGGSGGAVGSALSSVGSFISSPF